MPSQTVEITVGANPERLVTFGNRLYVAVQSTPQVKIIDTDSNTLSGAIDVGGAPWWMAFADIGTASAPDPKLFVRDGNEDIITVLNLALLDVPPTTIGAEVLGQTSGGEMASSNRNAGVFLLDMLNTRMLVLDTQTNQLAERIELGFRQRRLAVSPNGSRVYVTHPEDSLISVIDPTAFPAAITRWHVPSGPFDVAMTPRGDRVYVTYFVAQDTGLLQVIDAATGQSTSVEVGTNPTSVVGDDSRAYVSCAGAHRIDVVDTTTIPPRVVDQIPVNGSPSYLAFSSDASTLYAGNFVDHTVTAISLRP
jgi:DNA-binding beta-propeller fold protein YncE